MDNDKFQAHITEIDIALHNNSDSTILTNTFDDDINCKNEDYTNTKLTDRNSGGPILKEMLDQGPSAKAPSCSGLMPNNPSTRTWKRFSMGLKTSFPSDEEIHAGSK